MKTLKDDAFVPPALIKEAEEKFKRTAKARLLLQQRVLLQERVALVKSLKAGLQEEAELCKSDLFRFPKGKLTLHNIFFSFFLSKNALGSEKRSVSEEAAVRAAESGFGEREKEIRQRKGPRTRKGHKGSPLRHLLFSNPHLGLFLF